MNSVRHAMHPDDYPKLTSSQLREHFLIEALFKNDEITTVYSHYDRLIVGGANPVSKSLSLETFDSLKSESFLQRREMGIINVGGRGSISVDGTTFTLECKEALYIARGSKEVLFHPSKEGTSLYYFNSSPAHATYPTKKVSIKEAETVELGSLENSNHRTIRKLIVNSVVETCQLQMGLTELKTGMITNILSDSFEGTVIN